MNEHTPGFYAIEEQRMKCKYDISSAALMDNPHNDKIASEHNAIKGDYATAIIRHNLRTEEKITEIENQAYQYIKMSRMKRLIFDIKSHFK